MIDINKEAEAYLDRTYSLSYEITTWQKLHIKSFIAGHNSKATKVKVIQGQIDLLNFLDSKLQAKYEILTNMQQEYIGKMKEGQLASKKSGLRLAKEEIRRDLKVLQQQLKELEND
jgi:hypothetical protein